MMTPAQALHNLNIAVAQLRLTREEHNILIQSVQVLKMLVETQETPVDATGME